MFNFYFVGEFRMSKRCFIYIIETLIREKCSNYQMTLQKQGYIVQRKVPLCGTNKNSTINILIEKYDSPSYRNFSQHLSFITFNQHVLK